ncbi:hypothetical protein Trydic_g13468, partial [Trypoxylus dichotomus]
MTFPPLQRQSRPDILKFTTWIFLLPSIYGFLVLFLFVAAIIGTGRGMHSMNDGNIAIRIYTISFYKVAIYISIIFLWLMLLATAMLYFAHIPAVVICGAAKKGKFINRYLDRPYWENQTWIMYKLNKHIPTLGTSITIRMLLEKCSGNETIAQTLNLGEHITKSKLDIMKSRDDYLDIFLNQKFENFRNIFNYIQYIDYKHLNSSFILLVEDDLRRIENTVGNMRNLLIENSSQDLFGETILNAEYLIIALRNITNNFFESKRILVESKAEVINLMSLNAYLQSVTKGDLQESINTYLWNITDHVNCLHEEITRFIKHSLMQGFGKCTFLPYVYNKVEWLVCDYGLELL